MLYEIVNNFPHEILKLKGPVFVHVKVEPGNADVPIIDMSPEYIKNRFINEINKK